MDGVSENKSQFAETIQSYPARKVKLMKMSKGYNWEISVQGDQDFDAMLKELQTADAKLKLLYGGE